MMSNWSFITQCAKLLESRLRPARRSKKQAPASTAVTVEKWKLRASQALTVTLLPGPFSAARNLSTCLEPCP